MDSNNFKKSQNFDNIEKNKAHNPNLDSNPNRIAQDYVTEMKSKQQEATLEGFMNHGKNSCPADEWKNKEKEYEDAWQRNSEQNEKDQ